MRTGETDLSPPTTVELWQTERCPASHRVRQRLTELGLTYTIHQVPVEQHARTELRAAPGTSEIPVLVAGGETVRGEQAILAYMEEHYVEPPDAAEQRAKAAKAKRKELEAACPKLTVTLTP
jgi:glutathione S-transferase